MGEYLRSKKQKTDLSELNFPKKEDLTFKNNGKSVAVLESDYENQKLNSARRRD